jgi:hypothetical protein
MCYMCMKSGVEMGDAFHKALTSTPDPGFKPMAAPNTASDPNAPVPPSPKVGTGGLFRGLSAAPAAYGPGQGPQNITKTNGTGDPRIIWEDGHVAIIYAKDFPANTGMGRSKTRDDLKDAINATIDDQLVTAPGAGSAHKFIKVWLKDLLARPLPAGPAPKVVGRLPIDPAQFIPVAPKIAISGRYKGQIIPDFPHDCQACGGKFYQGMISSVHPTPDGRCPAETKVTKRR